MEVRHVTIGAPVSTGCLSSVVATTAGVRYAGKSNPTAFTGIADVDSEGRWIFTQDMPPRELSGSALVFGDATAQIVAWPSTAASGITFDFYDAEGKLFATSQMDAQGEPLAAVGTLNSFWLAFSSANTLSVMNPANAIVTSVETDGCVEPSSVAIGSVGDDAVLGYFCNGSSRSTAAQHLVVARVNGVTGEMQRKVLDVAIGAPTINGGPATGVPAAFFHDGELLFAHPTTDGALALTRVSTADFAVSTGVVTGMPVTELNANEKNPVFSVVQVGGEIGLTRAACNGHEDARSTGAFDVCHISAATFEAVCSEVDAPCQKGKLVAHGSDVTLLGCGWESPTLIPIDLPSIPVNQPGYFPTGYSVFEPLSLTCDGDACSALLELNSSQLITGHDHRLAFADLELAPGCTADACRASSPEPTAVFTESSDNPSDGPSVTLQRQSAGFPLGVVTLARDEQGFNYAPELSVLDRESVRWTQPVTSSAVALFAEGDGYVGLWSDIFALALHRYSVSAGDTVTDPDVMLRFRASGLPGLARCDGRILVDGVTQESSISPLEAALMSYDPATGAVSALFAPGYAAADSEKPSRSLGCVGDRVLVLDGLQVHQYSMSGERGPDVAIATPPATRIGDSVLTRLEMRGDHVLVASSGSAKNTLDVLLFYGDGTHRTFELPLAPNAAPIVSLAVAPDRGDGWLRVVYQSGNETVYALREGYVYASAYKLFE